MTIKQKIQNVGLKVRPAEGIIRGTDERVQIVHINYDSLEPIAITADDRALELHHDIAKVNWPWGHTTVLNE